MFWLEPVLRYNLTNLLTDSVTAAVTKSVSANLAMTIGGPISNKVRAASPIYALT